MKALIALTLLLSGALAHAEEPDRSVCHNSDNAIILEKTTEQKNYRWIKFGEQKWQSLTKATSPYRARRLGKPKTIVMVKDCGDLTPQTEETYVITNRTLKTRKVLKVLCQDILTCE